MVKKNVAPAEKKPRPLGVPVSMRLSAFDRKRLDAAAKSKGISRSELIRNYLDADQPERPPRRRQLAAWISPPMLGELRRIGNNINQIARHLNAVHPAGSAAPLPYPLLSEIRHLLSECVAGLYELVHHGDIPAADFQAALNQMGVSQLLQEPVE